MDTLALLPLITSLEDIDEPLVKDEIHELIAKDYVLGIMLWGSRATQFGEPDTDWDALIYVTQEHFDSMAKKDIAVFKFNEEITPRRLVTDFTYWSDSLFENQLQSPMDIDHAAYSEAIVLVDKTGQLENWRKKLAQYPGEKHEERIKAKWINLLVSYEYVQKNNKRKHDLDMKVNIYKTLTIAINIGFNVLHVWAPPLKWFSKYAKKYGMDEELFTVYSKAIEEPTMENTKKLIDTLKLRIEQSGVDLSNFFNDFFETIYPEGRKKLIDYSYF